jgi:hypothetical protein
MDARQPRRLQRHGDTPLTFASSTARFAARKLSLVYWKQSSIKKKARANGGLNPHLADMEETVFKALSYLTDDFA